MSDQDQQLPEQQEETEVTQTEEAAKSSFDDLLGSIKREDGSQKYRDVPSALSALSESQAHIKRLEQENKEMLERLSSVEQQAAKNIAMEEILNQLKTKQAEVQTSEKPSHAVNPDDLQSMLESMLEQREAKRTKEANYQMLKDTMLSKFGDESKAADFYKAKAKELGLGLDFLNEVAGRSPKAVLEILGINKGAAPTEELKPALNTERPVERTPMKPKSVMGGVSDKELTNAWRDLKARLEQQR